VLDPKSWVFLVVNKRTGQRSLPSLCMSPVWNYQLLILFLVLLSWSLKSGNSFRTAAQETSYKLSGQPSVAVNRNHPCLIGMKYLLTDLGLVIRITQCTHSYLLSGADQPACMTCQCPLTVKYILVECTNFSDTRTKYSVTSSLEELFRTVDICNVLDFIK